VEAKKKTLLLSSAIVDALGLVYALYALYALEKSTTDIVFVFVDHLIHKYAYF